MDNTKIITFTAPKGEGKTKWLLDKVFYNAQLDNNCYVIAKDENEYRSFCEAYGIRYHSVCKVKRLDLTTTVSETDIVFIDDLFDIINKDTLQLIRQAITRAKAVYVTISGSTIENPEDYV